MHTFQVGDILVNERNEECEIIAVLNHFIRIRNKTTGKKECYQIFSKKRNERKVIFYDAEHC